MSQPKPVLADAVVSAPDLTTRIRIVDLLKALSEKTTLVLVSHDIGFVALLCEDLVILERGRVVEHGSARDILSARKHPYMQRLLESTPRLPDFT